MLSEQIDHHVKEEEEEMFPKARKANLDLAALGERIAERKEALAGTETWPPASVIPISHRTDAAAARKN